MKKVIKAILILLGSVVIICLIIIPFDSVARKEINEMMINNVDLSKIEDGKYSGDFKNRVRKYSVEVTIKDHKIVSVRSTNGSVGTDYSSRLFNSVVKEQKVDVDTISGATITSKMILKAIENALKNGS